MNVFLAGTTEPAAGAVVGAAVVTQQKDACTKQAQKIASALLKTNDGGRKVEEFMIAKQIAQMPMRFSEQLARSTEQH